MTVRLPENGVAERLCLTVPVDLRSGLWWSCRPFVTTGGWLGNPVSPVTKHVWPIDHPVAAAWLYCVILVSLGWVIAQRRYKARTTD